MNFDVDPNYVTSAVASIEGDGHRVLVHKGVRFDPRASIKITGLNNTVVIEAGVEMRSARIQISGENNVVHIERSCRMKLGVIAVSGIGSQVRIGAGTSWESGSLIAGHGKAIHVGRDCMFSHEVVIRTDDAHGVFDLDTGLLLNSPDDVYVEDHVWLGNGARVNKGCRIGTGSVLSQMSLATGDMDANGAYAGVPARKIRDRITWSRSFSRENIPIEFWTGSAPASDK